MGVRRLWLGLGVLALAGCSMRPEDRIVGAWHPDLSESKIPKIPIPAVQQKVDFALQSMILKVRPDHTFVLVLGTSVEGKWSLTDHQIDFAPASKGLEGPLGSVVDGSVSTFDPGFDALRIKRDSPFGAIEIVMKKSS